MGGWGKRVLRQFQLIKMVGELQTKCQNNVEKVKIKCMLRLQRGVL